MRKKNWVIRSTNLGDRILWCRDTTCRLPLLPLLVVLLELFVLLMPFFAFAIICWIPGGFGAQLGLPWFGLPWLLAIFTDAVLLFDKLLLLLYLLVLLLLFELLIGDVLWLLLASLTIADDEFVLPNNDDLFGAIVIFVPFDGTVGEELQKNNMTV